MANQLFITTKPRKELRKTKNIKNTIKAVSEFQNTISKKKVTDIEMK